MAAACFTIAFSGFFRRFRRLRKPFLPVLLGSVAALVLAALLGSDSFPYELSRFFGLVQGIQFGAFALGTLAAVIFWDWRDRQVASTKSNSELGTAVGLPPMGVAKSPNINPVPPGEVSKAESLRPPTDAEAKDLADRFARVLADIGGTGNPADYLGDLTFLPPNAQLPADGFTVCGCCSTPFAAELRKTGTWAALNKKTGLPNSICAVCITFLNQASLKERGVAPYRLPAAYDEMGQQLAARYPGEPPLKIALLRASFIDARIRSARSPP
jgi:hypothetical protein